MKSYLFFYSLSTYQEWTRTGRDGRNPKKNLADLCQWIASGPGEQPLSVR